MYDMEPLFIVLFFALGFIPVVIVGSIISIFISIPLWSIVVSGIVVGWMLTFWMKHYG